MKPSRTKTICLTVAAVLIAGFYLLTPAAKAFPPVPSVKLVVPAYFYPAGQGLKHWQKLINTAGKIPVVAIANPASGPGKAVDPAYTALIKLAQTGKVTMVGYVSTNYGKQAAADIKEDIDDWVSFYPTIQGIFFDEQASEAAQVNFYLDLATYARTKIKGAFLITNPGTECSEEYFAKKVADTICIVEKGVGLEKYSPPAWASRYPAAQFYGLAYQVTKQSSMLTSLKSVTKKRLGCLFITDDKLPNPWDTLPPYWDAEVSHAKSL